MILKKDSRKLLVVEQQPKDQSRIHQMFRDQCAQNQQLRQSSSTQFNNPVPRLNDQSHHQADQSLQNLNFKELQNKQTPLSSVHVNNQVNSSQSPIYLSPDSRFKYQYNQNTQPDQGSKLRITSQPKVEQIQPFKLPYYSYYKQSPIKETLTQKLMIETNGQNELIRKLSQESDGQIGKIKVIIIENDRLIQEVARYKMIVNDNNHLDISHSNTDSSSIKELVDKLEKTVDELILENERLNNLEIEKDQQIEQLKKYKNQSNMKVLSPNDDKVDNALYHIRELDTESKIVQFYKDENSQLNQQILIQIKTIGENNELKTKIQSLKQNLERQKH